MFIDFSVENYRSIKGREVLSAIAQKQSTKVSNTRTHVKSDNEIAKAASLQGWGFEILPLLAIFGANASGKSNIVMALDEFLNLATFVSQDAPKFFQTPKLFPFKLDSKTIDNPTQFSIRVGIDNAIYTYSLVISKERIHKETLEYATSSSKQKTNKNLFNRTWSEKEQKYVWDFGKIFLGPHTQLAQNVKESMTFMSLLNQLDIAITFPLSKWLIERWTGISLGRETFDQILASHFAEQSPERRRKVVNIVKKFDVGITEIEIKRDESNRFEFEIYACHEMPDGEVIKWPFEEESIGTQRLFSFASRLEYAFNTGGALVIMDELGSHIHPNAVREMVRLFQSEKTNPRRAQLILTSHDITLQRRNLLRRDQIWFTQKRSDQSTKLYPLSDFKVRNDLVLDKAYLDGRFMGVPILQFDDDLISEDHLLEEMISPNG